MATRVDAETMLSDIETEPESEDSMYNIDDDSGSSRKCVMMDLKMMNRTVLMMKF